MLLIWMVFVIIVGRVLATATLFGDRCAAAVGARRRFVWLAGIIATALWPVVAIAAIRLGDIALAHGMGVGGVRDPRHLPWLTIRLRPELSPRGFEWFLAAAWGIASVVLLTRLIVFAAAARRWRRALPVAQVDGVRVRVSDGSGPLVSGLLTPEVIVPAWVLSLDPLDRALVLRHELSHRAARDTGLLWLAALAVALMPWNVMLWWQRSRLRLAIEMDCDARVLAAVPEPLAYARLLVRLATGSGESSWRAFAPTLALSSPRLEQRIAAMAPRRSSAVVTALYFCAALSAIVLALALRGPMVR